VGGGEERGVTTYFPAGVVGGGELRELTHPPFGTAVHRLNIPI